MSRSIQFDSEGNEITCMKKFDVLKYPCKECNREDCEEREEYHDLSNSRQKESIYGA